MEATREFWCYSCGKIERYEITAEPKCCGREMKPGPVKSPPENEIRVDVVTRGKRSEAGLWIADPPPNPKWISWFEIQLKLPGDPARPTIGVLGQTHEGMWEFAMGSNYGGSEGAAFAKPAAIEKMIRVALGDF